MAYRTALLMMFILGSLSCLTIGCATDKNEPTAQEEAEPRPENRAVSSATLPKLKADKKVTGMARDLRLLRKTTAVDNGLTTYGSSKEAIEAAARIFTRIKWVGMKRKDVLWMLGDPATISDYGKPIGPGEDAPLKYLFDFGYGGSLYILEFKDGRVIKLQCQGTY